MDLYSDDDMFRGSGTVGDCDCNSGLLKKTTKKQYNNNNKQAKN
jgi:hypothetical protein